MLNAAFGLIASSVRNFHDEKLVKCLPEDGDTVLYKRISDFLPLKKPWY
ncbi:hypothetical protein [Peribacillus simplex]|nr:hypothetical protein [Peribacillus simplex]WHY55854.1 hypothetical protein QNH43_22335 [Peribacillus simplex]